MANAGHLSDEELAGFDEVKSNDAERVRGHIDTCSTCRRRREELIRLREILVQAGQRESGPRRDVVPSAMLQLRLRRHGISNVNELLEGFAALVRGFACLFSLPIRDQRTIERARGAEDERHE